jgi:hypothetical protein
MKSSFIRDGNGARQQVFLIDTKEASRLISSVAQLRLTKAGDPSVLPATLLLQATQEIPQQVVRRQTI